MAMPESFIRKPMKAQVSAPNRPARRSGAAAYA